MILIQVDGELSMHGLFLPIILYHLLEVFLVLELQLFGLPCGCLAMIIGHVICCSSLCQVFSQLPWVQSEEPWSFGVWGQLVSGQCPCWSCTSVVLSLWLCIHFPDSWLIFHLLGMGGISCLHLPSWLASSSYTAASWSFCQSPVSHPVSNQ